MKRIWRHKWWVIAATLVVFLSVGAVAWATSGDGNPSCPVAHTGEAKGALLVATAQDGSDAGDAKPGAALRQKLKEKRDNWLKRHKALLDKVRDDMTREDQAKYDELIETIKEQREALQQARKDLAATIKELRELVGSYLDLDDGAPGTAAAGTL